MQIKKFYATSLPAAVKDIRRTLGVNAVILSTRHLKLEEMRGSDNQAARVEVTAALQAPDVELGEGSGGDSERFAGSASDAITSALKQKGKEKALDRYVAAEQSLPAVGPKKRASKAGRSGRSKVLSDSPRQEIHPVQSILKELRSLSQDLSEKPDSTGGECREGTFSRRDWAAIATAKAASARRSSSSPWVRASRKHALTADLLQRRLRHQGVEEALVQRLLARMFHAGKRVDRAAWSPDKPILQVEGGDRSTFGSLVDSVYSFLPQRSGAGGVAGHPPKMALVGPTGVGKTTTLAKIASYLSMEQEEHVGLITLDTYRVGAAEQLKTYARLLGVPLEIVHDALELDRALERFSEMDQVLIDTPGHSPNDKKTLKRLSGLLGQHSDTEVHLVLPSSLRQEEMEQVMDTYRLLCYKHVIFSKLDEALSWGNVLNAWILRGLEVSYFTMGQRVPEDLAEGSVEWLCQTMVDEKLPADPAPAAAAI